MQKITHNLTAEGIKGLVGDMPLMLEIGCHEGSDTAKFLAAMPGIILYCFDCEPRALARFKRDINDRRVGLIEKAVADLDGAKPFYASTGKAGHMADWDYSGSLREPTGHLTKSPEIGFKSPVDVPCVRLDTWLRGHPQISQIDFIWADIQGAQRDLIAGGRRGLAVTRYLYIECHRRPMYAGEPTQDDLIALLPGFEPRGLYGGDNILFENRRNS